MYLYLLRVYVIKKAFIIIIIIIIIIIFDTRHQKNIQTNKQTNKQKQKASPTCYITNGKIEQAHLF